MRNRSLFGPLLLILFGLLLLVRNFRPDFPFWDIVARYWPLVLVVWGCAKLLGAVTHRGTEPWRPSLTVGEFFLALFIVGVGLSAGQWVRHRADIPWNDVDFDWPWGQRYSFNQDLKQDAIEPNATLYVEDYAGDVRVNVADTKGISVSVSKQVRAGSEGEARKIADSQNAELIHDGNAYTVRAPGDSRMRTDLVITVPRKTPVRFEVRRGSTTVAGVVGDVNGVVEHGDLSVSDIEGNVRVQVRSGSLSAQNVKGNVEVEGRGNDVQVTDVTGQLLVRGDYSGSLSYARIAQGVRTNSSRTDMEVQNLPGRIEMNLGSLEIVEPGGAVMVNTRNKDVRVEDFDERVQIVDRGASVELRTTKLPLKDIDVENHSGPIELTVPDKSEFTIQATASRGEVESDFGPLQVQTGSDAGQIHGQVGRAGATVKLNTSYGAIRLLKTGGARDKGDEKKPGEEVWAPPTHPVLPAPPAAHAIVAYGADHTRALDHIQREADRRMREAQRHIDEAQQRTQRELERVQRQIDRAQ